MIRVDGIVIKSIDYGEAHRIIHIFTKEHGKISAIAMGAKKTKSKHSSTTQPLMLGCFVLYKKQASLGRINQSDIIYSFPKIRADLLLSTYAMYMVDLTDRVIEEEEVLPELYQLLVDTLYMIESGYYDPEILVRIFELKVFSIRGYRPHLDSCVYCNLENDKYNYHFSIKYGGFLCPKCVSKDSYAINISSQTAKLLRVFQYITLNKIGEISIKNQYRLELQDVSKHFIEEHFGLNMKWLKMIADIKKMYDS